MARPIGIIAYGKSDDRLRLAAIAKHRQTTGSKVLIDFIRQQYAELFGDLDPRVLAPEDECPSA